MRGIVEIILAVVFLYAMGSGSLEVLNKDIKKVALIKVQKGLVSLVIYTQKITK